MNFIKRRAYFCEVRSRVYRKLIREKIDILEYQNTELSTQLHAVQKVLEIVSKRKHEKDLTASAELRLLRNQIPQALREPVFIMDQEIIKLKETLANERRLRDEMEKQYRENNEEITHLYIEAEVEYFARSSIQLGTKRKLESKL